MVDCAPRPVVPRRRTESMGEGGTMKTLIRRPAWMAASTFVGLLPAASLAQQPANEYHVSPGPNVQDKGEVNTLDFDFKPPRMLEVNVPGVGKRVVWYMTY